MNLDISKVFWLDFVFISVISCFLKSSEIRDGRSKMAYHWWRPWIHMTSFLIKMVSSCRAIPRLSNQCTFISLCLNITKTNSKRVVASPPCTMVGPYELVCTTWNLNYTYIHQEFTSSLRSSIINPSVLLWTFIRFLSIAKIIKQPVTIHRKWKLSFVSLRIFSCSICSLPFLLDFKPLKKV